MHRILLLNGPNLNLLGRREPERYGRVSLDEVVTQCRRLCEDLGAGFEHLQSNAEGALIDRIHASADDGTTAIVINAGGLTHTSVALRDALIGVGLPWYEVHISNIHAREDFRRHSLLSDGAAGLIIGCGTPGYLLALRAACGRAAS